MLCYSDAKANSNRAFMTGTRPNRVRYKEDQEWTPLKQSQISSIEINPKKSRARSRHHNFDDLSCSTHNMYYPQTPSYKPKENIKPSASLRDVNVICSPSSSKHAKLNRQGVTITSIQPAELNSTPDSMSCYKSNEMVMEKRRLAKLLKSVNENLEKNEVKELINLYKQEIKAQWTLLSRVIDTLLLFVFTLGTFLLIVYLLTRIPRFPKMEELFW